MQNKSRQLLVLEYLLKYKLYFHKIEATITYRTIF